MVVEEFSSLSGDILEIQRLSGFPFEVGHLHPGDPAGGDV